MPAPNRQPIPLAMRTAQAPGGTLRLRVSPSTDGPLDRNAVLADVAAGKDVRLYMDILAFRQTEESNRNFIRFTPAAVRAMAATFVGQPFLRDHAGGDFEARGGRILASTYDGAEGMGEIRQTVELSAPWAVAAAARDLLDRFSISWMANSPDQPRCSIDGEPMFAWGGGCNHCPGDVVTRKDGTQMTCEAVFDDVQGTETSALSVPAVSGTGIEAIRTALALYRGQPEEKKMEKFQKLAAKLSIQEPSEEAFLVAVTQLQVDRDAAVGLHTAELAAHKATAARLAELEAAKAASDKLAHERGLEELLAAVRQKQPEHAELLGATVRVLAEVSLDKAREYVGRIPKTNPIGEPLLSRGTAPPLEGERTRLSEVQRKVNKQLGISDAEFLKRNPPEGE